ncbi:multidrug resistance efflux transporter family protein [Bacillus sp. PS06]|uniref:DMT family transporter n=1 Tax=Bacillus sp. PS06 TaxID=2764176 RepID=UPI00178761C1|nr:multidrug resistance efflux transporter family protein [Bacillus sp. PS06]MBD8067422.1 multidrug resistance efflux transporter family protein [Bacillus sp. PS06]
MKAILIGIVSSVFFAVTFILNRSMELAGGSWLWSASLRYFFMIPFLLIIVLMKGNLKGLFKDLRAYPKTWILWSTVGFGLFYGPITLAAASGPGWLVAGTWQFTIIAGALIFPLFYENRNTDEGTIKVRRTIPIKGLLFSSIIFLGIIIIQIQQASQGLSLQLFLIGILPVLIASFAYPLGNRKMMEHCKGNMDTFSRVLGMTLASLPFWIALASIGYATEGLPSGSQVFQSFIVALSSGVIATVLFFFATDMVKDDSPKLAAVEATQSTQILFVIIGEMLFLQEAFPSFISIIGIGIIIIGMLLHSMASRMNIVIPIKKAKSI